MNLNDSLRAKRAMESIAFWVAVGAVALWVIALTMFGSAVCAVSASIEATRQLESLR